MSILNIIIIILVLFGIAVFFRLIKNVFKAAIYVFVLLAIVLFVAGVWVYTDAAEFRKNIQEKPLTFILVEDDEMLAGTKILNMRDVDYLLFSNSTISEYQEYFNNKNFEKIRGDSYKLFVFNFSVLENYKKNFSYRKYNITHEEAMTFLKSDMPIDDAVDYFAKAYNQENDVFKEGFKEELLDSFENDHKFKGALFSFFVADMLPTQTLYIVKNMKSKEITVYPETAMFKALNYIPESWVLKSAERGGENQSEVLEEKG